MQISLKMEYKITMKASEVLENLERWRDLLVTFQHEDKTLTTRGYFLDVDEDMWSQYIKQFNMTDWYKEGAMNYGKVFECCKGSIRNIVYVHTTMMALRFLTKEPIPIGAKLKRIDYA